MVVASVEIVIFLVDTYRVFIELDIMRNKVCVRLVDFSEIDRITEA